MASIGSIGLFPATALAFTLSIAAASPLSGASPIEVLIHGNAAHRWVEATPDAPGSRAMSLPVADGASSVLLPESAPGAVVLCAGGEEGATGCERFVLAEGIRSVSVPGPVPGVRVTGRLLSGKSPLAGAWFGIIPDQLNLRRFFAVPLERKDGKLIRTVTCDAQGRFVVPLLAPGDYRLDIHSPGGRIDLSEPFTVPLPEKLKAKDKKAPPGPPVLDLGDKLLDDGVRVEVSVVDTAGQPVAKAGVGAGQERPGGATTVFETRTGSDGAAFLSRVDPALPLSVTCVAPGYVRLEQHFDSVPGLVRCVLATLARIQGRVIDADDKPLPEATVSLWPEGGAAKPLPSGEFSFLNLSPGSYVLTAAAPGQRAVKRRVEVGPEEAKLETLRLLPAESLAGKVVDGLTKKPVAGAAVRIADPQGLQGTETDEEGRFTLRAGSEGALGLEVEAAGYPVTPFEVSPEQQTAAEPLRLEVSPGGRIRAEVWDEEADAPCAGCRVFAQEGGRSYSLMTAADGSALSELLAPGRYSVGVERVRSLGSVVTVRGGDDRREVSVAPNQTVTVKIGEPLQRVQVAFSPPPPDDWNLQVTAGDRNLVVERSADGTFLMRRPRDTEAILFLFPLTRLPVAASRIRQAVLPADFSAPVLTLPLADGVVTGTLRRGDEAAPGEPLLVVSASDGAIVAQAGTDDQGWFSIPFIPPGTYSLVAGRQPLKVFQVGHGPAALGEVGLPGR